MKKLISILLISSLYIAAIYAQQNSDQGAVKIKKWSITTHFGWSVGGPCIQMEDEMIHYGFDDHRSGGWFGGSGTDHPYSEHQKPSWMISVKYYIKSPFSVGISGGMSNLGTTQGYKIESWGHSLDIDFLVYHISPIFSYNVYDIVKIGIGPSIYFTKAWESSNHVEGVDVEYKRTKVGFLVDFGIRIPKKTPFFFELNGQYRYVGKVDMGPFNENPYRDPLPKTVIKYNHGLISAGFGVRF
jgi:hypothetical protein